MIEPKDCYLLGISPQNRNLLLIHFSLYLSGNPLRMEFLPGISKHRLEPVNLEPGGNVGGTGERDNRQRIRRGGEHRARCGPRDTMMIVDDGWRGRRRLCGRARMLTNVDSRAASSRQFRRVRRSIGGFSFARKHLLDGFDDARSGLRRAFLARRGFHNNGGIRKFALLLVLRTSAAGSRIRPGRTNTGDVR